MFDALAELLDELELIVISDDGDCWGASKQLLRELCEDSPQSWLDFSSFCKTDLHPGLVQDKGRRLAGYSWRRLEDDQDQVKIAAHSYSEHFLNGVRLAVFRGETDCNKIAFVHFNRDGEHLIRCDERGRISARPEGFFDQREKAFEELHGF